MATYRRVYDSCHLYSLTAKIRNQFRNHTPGNRVWATFTITFQSYQPASPPQTVCSGVRYSCTVCLDAFCRLCLYAGHDRVLCKNG